MSQLIEIVRTLRSMPPLPNVAQRVLEVVRDPEYSIDQLVSLVRVDPSLTARILRLCNSALSGLTDEVNSVADAVAYVGTRNLVKLVLVSCSATYFAKAKKSLYTDPATLWKHTFACAVACQWLANRCGHPQADAAFTAGILHNIGKVAMSQMADDALVAGAADEASGGAVLDLSQLERRLFGIDHATAAGVVADAWALPRELRNAMRFHHDPGHLSGESPLPAILNLADTLVLMQGIGNPFPNVALTLDPAALSRLGLDRSEVAPVAAHLTEQLQRNEELLNLPGLPGR